MRNRLLLTLLILACVPLAAAAAVDGQLDPEYGAALSIQTTQTTLGDWPTALLTGSELDAAYGYVADGTLHLLIAGSYNRFYSEPLTNPNELNLFIDSAPDGQNELSAANPSVGNYTNLQSMSGLQFDSDFAPDFWLSGAIESAGRLFAYYAELPASGGGAGYFLGSSPGAPGTLSGGNNPFGLLASIDQSNEAGVGAGCGAASGLGVATGIEWAIPLAALGNPSGPIRICALLTSPGPDGTISNQILGAAPPGTCALGPAAGVDFGSVGGSQYFVIDRAVPVLPASWGRLKGVYRQH